MEEGNVETATSSGSIKGRRILYLIFATVTLLVLGLIYAWSIFARPIGASFASYGPMLSQVFQVSMFSFCISALFGAQIYKRVSPRSAVILAASLLCVGFLATALFASWGIWVLFVCYGVVAASGVGIGYNAIISLVAPWFPDRTGLCSGVMMMGFGISSLVFGSMANAAFAVMDWSIVFIIIAVVGTIIMLALAFLVKPAPADTARKLGMQGAAVTTKESPTKNQDILRVKVFWVYSIWGVAIVVCGLTLIGSAAQGAITLGVDAGFAALLVGLVSTMNGLGRVINGVLFDRFGIVFVMTLGAVIAIVSMTGLLVAFSLAGQAMSSIIYIIAGILIAFPYASVPVMNSAFTRRRFKASDFSKNLGIANCCIAGAAIINIIIGAFLGAPYAGNGIVIYGILVVVAIISLLSIIVFGRLYKQDIAKIDEELR